MQAGHKSCAGHAISGGGGRGSAVRGRGRKCRGSGGGGGWRGAAAKEEWIGLRDGCVMVGGWGRRVHVRHDVAQSGAAY